MDRVEGAASANCILDGFLVDIVFVRQQRDQRRDLFGLQVMTMSASFVVLNMPHTEEAIEPPMTYGILS